MRLLVFVLVIALLASFFVTAAATFDVAVNPVIKNFYPTQQGKYEVTITNKMDLPDEFSLSFTNTPKWSIETDPISYLSGIPMKANENKTFNVYVAGVPDYQFGTHDFNILVTSKNTGTTLADVIPVLLRNPSKDFVEYSPVVNIDVDIPAKIDPRDKNSIKINFLNRNKLNIKNITITVASKLFNTEKVTTLGSLERKTEEIPLDYDPLLPPVKDTISVTITINGGEPKLTTRDVQFLGYSTIEESTYKEDNFLKYTRMINYTNKGNVATMKKLIVKTSFFEQLFSSTQPEAKKMIDNGERQFVWEIELQPQETRTIELVINYRIVFLIIFIIALLIGAYYFFRSPMTIAKESHVVRIGKEKTEDGISHLKVLIHIKNRTNTVVEHVKIIDRIPHLVELEKEFGVGTLHPEKVLHHEIKGTIVKWDLPVVEPYEERIIQYQIKSKLKILGTITLPPASLKYKNKNGNEVRISSNRFIAGSDDE